VDSALLASKKILEGGKATETCLKKKVLILKGLGKKKGGLAEERKASIK